MKPELVLMHSNAMGQHDKTDYAQWLRDHTTTAANTVCKLKTETLLGGTCNAKATHTWMHARRVA